MLGNIGPVELIFIISLLIMLPLVIYDVWTKRTALLRGIVVILLTIILGPIAIILYFIIRRNKNHLRQE